MERPRPKFVAAGPHLFNPARITCVQASPAGGRVWLSDGEYIDLNWEEFEEIKRRLLDDLGAQEIR